MILFLKTWNIGFSWETVVCTRALIFAITLIETIIKALATSPTFNSRNIVYLITCQLKFYCPGFQDGRARHYGTNIQYTKKNFHRSKKKFQNSYKQAVAVLATIQIYRAHWATDMTVQYKLKNETLCGWKQKAYCGIVVTSQMDISRRKRQTRNYNSI